MTDQPPLSGLTSTEISDAAREVGAPGRKGGGVEAGRYQFERKLEELALSNCVHAYVRVADKTNGEQLLTLSSPSPQLSNPELPNQ
ncbi:hypothetical protein EGR_04302 [Echinococcus granulosus]|uniref:Uncharacterized protein n=1 Tax=Echinococcus granulosus TaxID=6210 RepID=W6UIG4_ECHGR|nr:hypothetical protein EGR_04302 [Echinococcus granulosus]EUB60863.1 hypothetical protein EGR_04302 [Echinococcus granulosus]